MMETADLDLLNAWQRGFPLTPRPFAAIARSEGDSEASVIERFRALRATGAMDRIGPVFRPNTIGASTLAAIAAPPGRIEEVASVLESRRAVNHNYEREHRYNLWFVATGPDLRSVEATLTGIEQATGLPVIRLPLLDEFHIDLGFDLRGRDPRPRAPATARPTRRLGRGERGLAAWLAPGLPIVERPYASLGQPEDRVIDALRRWVDAGVVRRLGAVARHRPLGYRANAMCVWDVPDALACAVGARLATEPSVTLCYRRARAPGWPYNLYCMIHGHQRADVKDEVAALIARNGLAGIPHEVLFSRRCFGQRSAWYG